MRIHQQLEGLPSFHNAIITFGSFDGVHHGHTELAQLMKEKAVEVGGETVVVTFDPHPRQVIYPGDSDLQLLSTKEEKIRLFHHLAVDHLVFCPFTIEFSQINADEYITEFIIEKFNPKYIVIGYDHRFGKNRTGNIDFLRSYEASGGFQVLELAPQMADKIRVSSTKIRNFIGAGEMEKANRLLGHPYLLSGEVIKGHQIGEKLGYPTANIKIGSNLKLIPPNGIYAAYVYHQDTKYDGMLYIGNRPTVSPIGQQSIEVNIFDFTEDIYGEEIFVEVLGFMRDDQVFSSLEGLQKQLDLDKAHVSDYLQSLDSISQSTAIVILNYNGLHHLQTHLPSVVRLSPAQIIVADNGSTDQSVSWLKEYYPNLEIIEMDTNYGFAEGYNVALKKVRHPYLVLLNSDVDVTTGWMEPLLDHLRSDAAVGACQPKIKSYDQNNTFEYAGACGGLIDWLGYPFCQGRILSEVEEDYGQYDRTKEIFWATGAAMVIRRKTFVDFGGFDASFFAHMEEIDLCWRMKKAGYRISVVPVSVIYHKGGGTLNYTSPRKTYLNFRNGMTLLLKNERGLKLLWMLPLRLAMDLLAGIRFIFVGEGENAQAVWKAMTYTFRHIPETWKKRKRTEQLIKSLSIGPDNTRAGRYLGSIVWEFFVLGKKNYRELRKISSKPFP